MKLDHRYCRPARSEFKDNPTKFLETLPLLLEAALDFLQSRGPQYSPCEQICGTDKHQSSLHFEQRDNYIEVGLELGFGTMLKPRLNLDLRYRIPRKK